MTFARDHNTFYATLASGGDTYLVRGDLRERTMVTLRRNAECPSLSPDGTRVVYKKRVGSRRRGATTCSTWPAVARRRWPRRVPSTTRPSGCDDSHVLYRVGEDLWKVPADGGGRARLYLAGSRLAGHGQGQLTERPGRYPGGSDLP